MGVYKVLIRKPERKRERERQRERERKSLLERPRLGGWIILKRNFKK